MERKLQNIIPELSDLELAALVCLIANEHCIIRAAASDIDQVQKELQLIATRTFGFHHATLECSAETKLKDFDVLMVEEDKNDVQDRNRLPDRDGSEPYVRQSLKSFDRKKLANLIIAKNLDKGDRNVQVQALEVCDNQTPLSPPES